MLKKLFALLLFILAFNFYAGAQMKLTGDPWIFQAYNELFNRPPSAWELNINNYNGGSWNNYGELKDYVMQYRRSIALQRVSITTTSLGNGTSVAFFNQNGILIAADLITNDGGTLVATGGGNIHIPSGSNLTIKPDLAGVTFGSKYAVQSTGTKIIPSSGKGALIIR